MKTKLAISIFGLSALIGFCGGNAFGESAPKAKQQKRVAARALASTAGGAQVSASVPRAQATQLGITIGLLGGYGQFNSNNVSEQASRDLTKFNKGAYLALMSDIRLQRYIGADIDAYYGFGPSRSSTSVDKVNGVISNNAKNIKGYGAMTQIKGRYPIFAGPVKLVPMVGAGFAFAGVQSSSTNNKTNQAAESKTTILTPYASVGLEVKPVTEVSIQGDYSRSFFARATIDTTGAEQVDADSSRLERFRLGVYYQFSDTFGVGTQVVYRRVQTEQKNQENPNRESSTQIAGAFLVRF